MVERGWQNSFRQEAINSFHTSHGVALPLAQTLKYRGNFVIPQRNAVEFPKRSTNIRLQPHQSGFVVRILPPNKNSDLAAADPRLCGARKNKSSIFETIVYSAEHSDILYPVVQHIGSVKTLME